MGVKPFFVFFCKLSKRLFSKKEKYDTIKKTKERRATDDRDLGHAIVKYPLLWRGGRIVARRFLFCVADAPQGTA